MAQFRTKSRTFEAVQWTGDSACLEESFFPQNQAFHDDAHPDGLRVELDGVVMWAAPGDWVVKQRDGSVVVISRDAFAALYEDAGQLSAVEELLVKGVHLVEDAVDSFKAHPTTKQLRDWLAEARKHVPTGTVSVRVGPEGVHAEASIGKNA